MTLETTIKRLDGSESYIHGGWRRQMGNVSANRVGEKPKPSADRSALDLKTKKFVTVL